MRHSSGSTEHSIDSGRQRTPSRRAERLAAMLPARYEFQRVLGKGGAAYVILANDTTRKQPVAVKILRPELATAVGESRFHREIEILSALDHPDILPLLDHGAVTAHLFYFTMPYVEGPTLRQFIEQRKRLTLDAAVRITQSVANALDYAHGRGVIHRDIKPANILIADGRTLLADFGIARAMAVEQARQLTASGVTLGTAEYMSPEQIEAVRELDGRCDVYALGCVVYEMLGGEPPFTGLTERAILAKHMREPPKSIRELQPDVPAAVDDAIIKALAKVRANRFYRAGDFANAISAAAIN